MSGETRLRLAAAAAVAVLMLVYSQTQAFAWDEGYHLVAAHLLKAGRRPYLDFCFPQTPLNAYWNAGWMWVLGESWRGIHAVAALLCCGAALLAAGWARTRFPAAAWRAPAALAVLLMVGLNVLVVAFGPIGQPYALALILMVVAFRLAVKASESVRPGMAALAGLAAGGGAAATLLTAPVGLVLLVWILVYNQAGGKWKKAGALAAGEAAAFLPLAWLFVQDPGKVFFNVVQYEALYRQVEWEGALAHNATVWISWLDSSHGLLLALLAAGGLVFARFGSGWPRAQRAELYLSGWLAAALLLHISSALPTFRQYYLLVVPFLAIPAAAGLYAFGSRLIAADRPYRSVAALAVLLAAGLATSLSQQNAYTWPLLEKLARRVEEVTPRGAPLLADENIYFLTHRTPPSGLELNDSHKLDFPKEMAARLHLVPEAEIERRIEAGAFATVESCGEYAGFEESAAAVYRQKAEVSWCKVYWGRK